jgi:phytanoyl-CoA hydroxylase
MGAFHREYQPYRTSVAQYTHFKRRGFVAIPGLIPAEDIAELRQHTEDLMHGRLPEQKNPGQHGLEAPPADMPPHEKAQFFLRIHMLHRRLELHERYMLHPRVLDVLQSINGPDVLAMQTMLFIKPPGKPGQGWHQDTYYIPTHPDTLIGAWIAIDDCDEFNGAMWMADGSGTEPIYPPKEGYGFGDRHLNDCNKVGGVSDVDDSKNDLSPIANRYPQVLVPAKAGDVVFFNGHILHRSKQNVSTDRFRRAFVSHYCNARSFTQWGADGDPKDPHTSPCVDAVTKSTNGSHILARGDTHLAFAQPRFGTPCAAVLSKEERAKQSQFANGSVADMDSGLMDMKPMDPNVDHDHSSEEPAAAATMAAMK